MNWKMTQIDIFNSHWEICSLWACLILFRPHASGVRGILRPSTSHVNKLCINCMRYFCLFKPTTPTWVLCCQTCQQLLLLPHIIHDFMGVCHLPSPYHLWSHCPYYLHPAPLELNLAQRGGRCPIPGNIQGQAGRDPEQPDQVEDVPAHCRGVGLDL